MSASSVAKDGSQSAAPRDPVAAWVAEGIITPGQAERIRRRPDAPRPTVPARRTVTPLVVEALGYLGGAIVTVAVMLIGGRYWTDIGEWSRLSLLAAAAVTSLLVGRVASARWDEVGERLRSALWLVSASCVAGLLAVWGRSGADLGGTDLTLLVVAGAAAYATGLFLLAPAVLQQVAMMGLWAASAAALAAELADVDSGPGFGMWIVGVLWVLLGELGALRPVRLARVMGALLALLGATMATSDRADAAIVLALATVAAVVVLAVVRNDLAILGLGSLGAIQATMVAVDDWFPSSLAAPVALLVVGAALVLGAVFIAGRSHEDGEPSDRPRRRPAR